MAEDRNVRLAFYDFPAEHWKPIRTGNPIESTFATVRHRTRCSKGCLSDETAKIMVFKTVHAAQTSWRKLDGQNQLPKIIQGIMFTDGIETVHDHAGSFPSSAGVLCALDHPSDPAGFRPDRSETLKLSTDP